MREMTAATSSHYAYERAIMELALMILGKGTADPKKEKKLSKEIARYLVDVL